MPTEKKTRGRLGEEEPKRFRYLTRESVITALGVVIVLFELVNAELLGRSFHYEFLVLAGGCLGLAIAGWGDRRNP